MFLTVSSLRFLHISDIHFRKGFGGSQFDLDRVLREKVESALGLEVTSRGPLSGILISGDIAFGGKPEEFATAEDWIERVCSICGCDPSRVYVVPGNHDVDRDAVRPDGILDVAQQGLRACHEAEINQKLQNLLNDDGERFFAHLKGYRDFAQRYSCATDPVDGMAWTDQESFQFGDGTPLRIHGINTALISNTRDHHERARLISSAFQYQIARTGNFVTLVLAHHPPDWLRDGDEMVDVLNACASIQLYGHKHRPRNWVINSRSLVVAAGAMHPARNEGTWLPCFNILELDLNLAGEGRALQVKLWRYRWIGEDQEFAPVPSGTASFQQFRLELDPRTCTIEPLATPTQANQQVTPDPKPNSLANVNPRRFLVYRFVSLPFPTKVRIADSLELLEAQDGMLGFRLSDEIVTRADELGKLGDLWEAVSREDPSVTLQKNPFSLRH